MSGNSPRMAPTRLQRKLRQLSLSTLAKGNIPSDSLSSPSLTSYLNSNMNENDNGLLEKRTSTDVDPLLDINSPAATPISAEFPDLNSNSFKFLEEFKLNVNNGNQDSYIIRKLCDHLKSNGHRLDEVNREQMEICFNLLLNLSRDHQLDSGTRTRILEVIELQAMKWQLTDQLSLFYKKGSKEVEDSEDNLNKNVMVSANCRGDFEGQSNFNIISAENNALQIKTDSVPLPMMIPSISLKPPLVRKVVKKIPNKNLVKDEFIIRNADSGKVSSGAKERLIQITGPTDECIDRAKNLIEDTIKRNASPVPLDHQSMEESLLSSSLTSTTNLPYVKSVNIGSDLLIISGSNSTIVQEAKTVLEHHFNRFTIKRNKSKENLDNVPAQYMESGDQWKRSGQEIVSGIRACTKFGTKSIQKSSSGWNILRCGDFQSDYMNANEMGKEEEEMEKRKEMITYEREFLMECRKLPICQKLPFRYREILANVPDLLRSRPPAVRQPQGN